MALYVVAQAGLEPKSLLPWLSLLSVEIKAGTPHLDHGYTELYVCWAGAPPLSHTLHPKL